MTDAATGNTTHAEGEDIVARLRTPSTNDNTMLIWDRIRELLLIEDHWGTLPREMFESILDGIDEERAEAASEIERLRRELAAADTAALRPEGWLYDHRFNGAEHDEGASNVWEVETRFSKTEPRGDFTPISNIRAVYCKDDQRTKTMKDAVLKTD